MAIVLNIRHSNFGRRLPSIETIVAPNSAKRSNATTTVDGDGRKIVVIAFLTQ
jgi:hypothetical protein